MQAFFAEVLGPQEVRPETAFVFAQRLQRCSLKESPMAKSQRKSLKALNARAEQIVPLRARLAAEVYVPFDVEKAAWEIVAEIMAHFGAGYAAQRQLESRERVPGQRRHFQGHNGCPQL